MIAVRARIAVAAGALAILAVLAWLLWPAGGDVRGGSGPVAASSSALPAALPPLPPQIERAMAGPDGGVAVVPSADTVLLFGFVRDREGRPVPSATVRALPKRRGEALVALTGPEGEYVIPGAPPALDRIEVSATGYVPTTTTSPALTGIASRRVRFDVILEALPGVRGIVRCDGRPVGAARVFLEPQAPDPGPNADGTPSPLRRRERAIAAAQSGPDGRFSIELESLPPPPLRVRAWSGTCGEGQAAYEGGPVTVDLEGGATISGRVIDARTQRPIPSYWISASTLLRDSGGPPALAIDDDRGEFVLGPLAPGSQRLYVAAPGYQPANQNVELTAGARVTDLVLALTKSAEVRGRVTDARTRQPIEGASVAPAEWAAEVLSDAVGAVTGPDGRYVLAALPGKPTTVVASARGYRTLMQGGVDGRSTKPITLDIALTPLDGDGSRGMNELVGIGAQLAMNERGVEVMGTVEGGPAEKQLKAGDIIVQVDDTPVSALELGDVVQSIRGEQGTEVVLWVQRGGGEPQRITFSRARVSWQQRQ